MFLLKSANLFPAFAMKQKLYNFERYFMSKILVFTEFQATGPQTNLKRSSQELLQFASSTGKPVVALAFGAHAVNASSQLAHHGAKEVLLCKDPAYDAYNPELFASAL